MKLYVGSYTEDILFGTGKVLQGKGEGIHIYDFDVVSGVLQPIAITPNIPNPSYLTCSPCGSYLFAVNELKHFRGMNSGSVSSYRINPAARELQLLSIQPSFGTDPCHLTTNRSGSRLFLANFMSGSISWYVIQHDGTIGEALETIQHEGSSIDSVRQAGPHAHAAVVSPDDRYLLIPDLGLDAIVIYEIDYDRNVLMLKHTIQTKPGSGPRFMVFHPHAPVVYLINELDSTVYLYQYDESNGNLVFIEEYSTLPQGYREHSTCSDICITPSGTYLYASNRGHDSLACYYIDQQTGVLRFIAHTSTQGRCPRNFTITPDGAHLLAANQDSDTIVIFSIEEQSGELTHRGDPVRAPTPVCLCFDQYYV